MDSSIRHQFNQTNKNDFYWLNWRFLLLPSRPQIHCLLTRSFMSIKIVFKTVDSFTTSLYLGFSSSWIIVCMEYLIVDWKIDCIRNELKGTCSQASMKFYWTNLACVLGIEWKTKTNWMNTKKPYFKRKVYIFAFLQQKRCEKLSKDTWWIRSKYTNIIL